MPLQKIIFFISLFGLFLGNSSQSKAQGGGPPMLTDDPGTPGNNNWEINSTINTSFRRSTELEVPLLDINYGLKNRTQLKIEMPYILVNDSANKFNTGLGNPLPGIKFRFVEDTIHSFTISTFPQISVPLIKGGERELKLPVEFEKQFGIWTLGEEVGYISFSPGEGNFFSGTLVGVKLSSRFDLMGEIYVETNFLKENTTSILANTGLRFVINDRLIFMHSMGTQLAALNTERTYFISFTGVQWLF